MAARKFIISFLFSAICLTSQVHSDTIKNNTEPIVRNDLVLGSIQASDRLLHNEIVLVQAKPGEIVTDNVFFAGCLVRINYITATEIQSSAGGTVELIAGGIGENIAFLTLSSAVGGELWYVVNMYGH